MIFQRKNLVYPKWGFTFSSKYCDEMGLDPTDTLNWITESFKFKSIRLCAYWDQIQPKQDAFDLSELNKQIEIAYKNKLEITLAIGRKVPRWPEFHDPDWAIIKDKVFLYDNFFKYFEQIISNYFNDNRITYFQIENEPYFSFGENKFGFDLFHYEEEIKIAKNKTKKQIISTDSGEWGNWKEAAKTGDRIGVNVYTIAYNNDTKHYNEMKRQPSFYQDKASNINKKVFIAELQAEPWGPVHLASKLELFEAKKSMNTKRLQKNATLAANIGFDEAWFWGVEWWKFIQKSYPEFVNKAKEIINT